MKAPKAIILLFLASCGARNAAALYATTAFPGAICHELQTRGWWDSEYFIETAVCTVPVAQGSFKVIICSATARDVPSCIDGPSVIPVTNE